MGITFNTPLSQMFNYTPQAPGGLNAIHLSGTGIANSTPTLYPKTPTLYPKTQTLPNGGGTYNAAGSSAITPAPIFTGIKPVQQVAPVKSAPVVKQANGFVPVPGVNYDKYRDPKTGEIMTPEEYAIYLGNKIPKGNGEITNYAGDALTNPNETAEQLNARATTLNNSRNDIATGAADPYKVGNQSGVAYSPTELKAIENAYAGVYDPALQDVFARLKTTQEAEKQKTDLAQAKEMEVFKTNESIRQWRATTGTAPRATGSGGKEKSNFTQTQLNNGAINAGLSMSTFDSLDDDIKNFYINPPMAVNSEDKKVPIYENFAEDYASVLAGDLSAEQLSSEISSSSLSPAVKQYFISQIPAEPEEKEGWIKRVWGAITGN